MFRKSPKKPPKKPLVLLRIIASALALSASVAFAPPLALAQDSTQLQSLERIESLEASIRDINRILEEDLRELRQSIEASGGLSSQESAQIIEHLGSMDARLNLLGTRFEQVLGLATDNEFRLLRLEKRLESVVRFGLDFGGIDENATASANSDSANSDSASSDSASSDSASSDSPDEPNTTSSNTGANTGVGTVPPASLTATADQETLWTIDNGTLTQALADLDSDASTGGEPSPEAAAGASEIDLALAQIDPQITPTPQILPDVNPEEQYSYATGLALQNDWDTAEQAFAEFIALNAGHDLEADAFFWLGRVQFERGLYPQAVETFTQFQSRWPDDSRTPKTTLWIGEAVINFATADEACALLASLPNFLDDPTDSFFERLDALKTKAQCPE